MNHDSRFPRVRARIDLARISHGHPQAVRLLADHGHLLRTLCDLSSRLGNLHKNSYLSNGFRLPNSLENLPKNLYLEDLDFLGVERSWAELVGNPENRLKAAQRRQVTEFLRGRNQMSTLPLPDGVELHRAGQRVWLSLNSCRNTTSQEYSGNILLTPSDFMSQQHGVLTIRPSIVESISIRKWSQGEKFRPATRRNRKISDWLSEAGVHPAVRGHWPVISLENEIVAVPGLGVAEHARPKVGGPELNIYWKANSPRDEQVSR